MAHGLAEPRKSRVKFKASQHTYRLPGVIYVYGSYVGMANGEFLQTLGVRKDAKIVAALQAPANTYFSVRHSAWSGGQLMERWRFLSVDRNPLDEREAPAAY